MSKDDATIYVNVLVPSNPEMTISNKSEQTISVQQVGGTKI
jgi:hypothetical protein